MNIQATQITPMQRSHGEAAVAIERRSGRSRLQRLRQQGSAKAILPEVGNIPEVVFLNTSGGLTGGDRLSFRLHLGNAARAVATTQTAERAYRAGGGVAEVNVKMSVGNSGWLDWLPQETILFDGSALVRRTTVDLIGDAGCLVLEAVVLGRPAMGEILRNVLLRDTRIIRRDGVAIVQEPLLINDAALKAGYAVLGGARAFASIIMVGTGAEAALPKARAVLDEPGVDAAASAWGGKLSVRLMASDGWPLRQQIRRVLAALRSAPLPRVWQI